MFNDLAGRVRKVIDHNRGAAAAVALALLITATSYGCQATIESPFSDRSVGRTQLEGEVMVWKAKIESAYLELEAQEAKAQAINDALMAITRLAAPASGPIGGPILALITAGALFDNRRKDGQIRIRNAKLSGTGASNPPPQA